MSNKRMFIRERVQHADDFNEAYGYLYAPGPSSCTGLSLVINETTPSNVVSVKFRGVL